jgi:transcriptional regulator with XRE-family HTH domain
MAVGDVLARAIAAERIGLGWTQKQLAEASGLPAGVIARIETVDRQVTIPEALRIAEALGVTVAHLLRRAEPAERARFGLQP